MTFFYTTCLNRDARARTRLVSINLAMVVLTADLKTFGPAKVVSGPVGEAENGTSLGACLRRFERGIPLRVPDQSAPITFRGWLFSFVGDAPAVAEMVGTKKSFSLAKNPCNLCENACLPNLKTFSKFLSCACLDDRNHDPGCEAKFASRTAARDAIHAASATPNEMQLMGVTTFDHAFVRVPNGGRDLAQKPGAKDGMHNWFEGVTTTQAASTLFMMVRVHGWCSKAALRKRAKEYAWPKDKKVSRPWYIPEKVFKGTTKLPQPIGGKGRGRGGRGRGRGQARGKGGGRGRGRAQGRGGGDDANIAAGPRPAKDTTMPYTAHHMWVWAMNSIELLRPFLPPNAMDFAFWRSWVHHVEILTILTQPAFSRASLGDLENTMERWYDSFFMVPQYTHHWVPKFHFCQHLAQDIWRFGPTRLNWCFAYEAKNQPLKRGCKRNNYHNPPKSATQFWCESSDFHLQKGTARRAPRVCPGDSTREGPACAFPGSLGNQLQFMATYVPAGDGVLHYCFLESVSCDGQELRPFSYAMVQLDPPHPPLAPRVVLCKIDHLISVSDVIFAWAYVYPLSVLAYDAYGVLHIPGAVLHPSYAEKYMLLAMEGEEWAPMWHFLQSDGTITFLSKW